MVKRRNPPNKGRWAIPGGLVELGESVQDAAKREVLEETGLRVALEGLLDVQTDVHFDRAERLEYHYVLVDYLARPVGGRFRLNPESSDWGWFSEGEIKGVTMSRGTRSVIGQYFKGRR